MQRHMKSLGFGNILLLGLREVGTWRRRRSGRKELGGLSARELDDIGLSPWDVEREIRKSFWQA